MRALLLILALLASLLCKAQIPTGAGSNPILDFALSNEGDKVGKGVCFDLVKEACEQKNRRWYKEIWCDSKELKKYEVAKPQAGDVIRFKSVQLERNGKISTISQHIGIIVEIVNDSIILYAEQNVIHKGEPTKYIRRYYGEKNVRVAEDSKVIFSEINPLSVKKGKIVYYRF